MPDELRATITSLREFRKAMRDVHWDQFAADPSKWQNREEVINFFIGFAFNALPALLDALEAALADKERMDWLLEKCKASRCSIDAAMNEDRA